MKILFWIKQKYGKRAIDLSSTLSNELSKFVPIPATGPLGIDNDDEGIDVLCEIELFHSISGEGNSDGE